MTRTPAIHAVFTLLAVEGLFQGKRRLDTVRSERVRRIVTQVMRRSIRLDAVLMLLRKEKSINLDLVGNFINRSVFFHIDRR